MTELATWTAYGVLRSDGGLQSYTKKDGSAGRIQSFFLAGLRFSAWGKNAEYNERYLDKLVYACGRIVVKSGKDGSSYLSYELDNVREV